jgi:hypothetical protein
MLACSGSHRQATVTVQIWIIGGPAERPKGQLLTVNFSEAYSDPPENRLEQDTTEKQVEVGESPAILQYKVQCAPDTKAGDIAFTATIRSAPAGFDVVDPDPAENGMVKVHVKR